VTDVDLTIRILREIQNAVVGIDNRLSSLEEKVEVTNERLSLVERGVTFLAAQVNVMRRHMGIEDRKTDDEIRDLQLRVTKLEDLVKP
jgi:hypothetical protein